MKPKFALSLLLIALFAPLASSQEKSNLPEAYKNALNRLQSLTVFPEPAWHFRSDVAHPEDPSLNDSDWQRMKEGDSWKDGTRVLRRWVEIPKSVNGFDVRGSRVELHLRFESQDAMVVTVFSNRSQVARTDAGHHEFTYSILPHAGTWRDALIVHERYNLNYPLLAYPGEKHAGTLAETRSFLSAEQNNVIVTAFKKAEDSDDFIIRFYEWAGKSGNVRLQFFAPIQSALDTNLVEKPAGSLSVQLQTVVVPTEPFEIRTVRVHSSRPQK